MFYLIVIPTVGHLALSRAVESVLGQSIKLSDFEVIVVSDSGGRLARKDRVLFVGISCQEFQRTAFFTAISRSFYVLATILTSGKYLWYSDFWNGNTNHHFFRFFLTLKGPGKDSYQITRWGVNY